MKKLLVIVSVVTFLIIFAVVAYFIFGFVFGKVSYWILGVGNIDSSYECKLEPKAREFNYARYYNGPLIDTHVHMPVASKRISDVSIKAGFEDMPAATDISTDYINCLFDSEGIAKSFGFYIVPNIFPGHVIDHVKATEKKYPGKFVKFFMPPLPLTILNPSASKVDELLSDNPGLFQGYGEARFDFNLGKNANPEDEYLLEMYALADKHDLVVQLHPDQGQLDDLERLLKKYPDVKFLAHVMPDYKKEVGELMGKYKNLYYSLDAEIHYIFGYQTIQDNKGPTKEEYLKFIRENFDSMLKEALGSWKQIVEAHSDQFTWGSDRWYAWHFDSEVGGLVTEFGRTFIGHLDPAIQEMVAYKNAEKLLRER